MVPVTLFVVCLTAFALFRLFVFKAMRYAASISQCEQLADWQASFRCCPLMMTSLTPLTRRPMTSPSTHCHCSTPSRRSALMTNCRRSTPTRRLTHPTAHCRRSTTATRCWTQLMTPHPTTLTHRRSRPTAHCHCSATHRHCCLMTNCRRSTPTHHCCHSPTNRCSTATTRCWTQLMSPHPTPLTRRPMPEYTLPLLNSAAPTFIVHVHCVAQFHGVAPTFTFTASPTFTAPSALNRLNLHHHSVTSLFHGCSCQSAGPFFC